MRAFLAVCYVLMTLTSTGCTNAATDRTGAQSREDARLQGRELRKPAPERAPSQRPLVTGEVSDEVLQRVKTALITELGRAPKHLEILVAAEMVWPNSALGCAHPGRNYQPIPIAGQRVVLSADGRSYDYRVAGELIMLCDRSLQVQKEAVTR